jgi:hypothetical protein
MASSIQMTSSPQWGSSNDWISESDALNILEALEDPHLFGPWFSDRATWSVWTAFLAALFGLQMTQEQRDLYKQCTGRSEAPTAPAREGWLVCGRRAGKSFILAITAVYLAVCRDYSQFLAPGERGTILIVAADRKQARVIFRYISAMLKGVAMFAQLIENERAESFDLTNRVTIEVGTASYRTTRGYTFIAVLADELAFWRSEDSASPDYEVIAAVRPGMATIPGAMLLCASSPYARRGALFDAYQRHFGKDGSILVWQAATRVMNPTVPQTFIDEEMEKDPATARAEYLAEFRTDFESFIEIEKVRACISPGVYERPPDRRNRYVAFVDPSGGSGQDSFTLAIAHKEAAPIDGVRRTETLVLDAVREVKPPFAPEAVCEEMADLMKRYRITKCAGDRYAGGFPPGTFRKFGINYEPSDKSKSELFIDLLPHINSRMVDLLDNDRMVTQLVSLERRTSPSGKDLITHPPAGHDDLANAIAGALCRASEKRSADDRRSEWHSPPKVNIGYQDLKERYRLRTNWRRI